MSTLSDGGLHQVGHLNYKRVKISKNRLKVVQFFKSAYKLQFPLIEDTIEGPVPEGDQTTGEALDGPREALRATGEALVLYINIIRIFVCLSVCMFV